MPLKMEIEKMEDIHFRVHEISRLGRITSPVCSVRGIPWTITITKENRDPSDTTDVLRVYLNCLKESRAKWSMVASASFHLVSSKDKKTYFKEFLQPTIFTAEQPTWGEELAEWKSVRSTRNGFAQKDSILIKVSIDAQIYRANGIEWEQIEGKTDSVKYRMTINNINDIALLRSPVFPINGHPFVFDVAKSKQTRYINEIEEYLCIYLRCLEDSLDEWQCRTRLFFTIVPFESGAKPFCRSDSTYDHFDKDHLCFGWSDLMPWSQLEDPSRHFVQRNRAILEFEIQREICIDGDINMDEIKRNIKMEMEDKPKMDSKHKSRNRKGETPAKVRKLEETIIPIAAAKSESVQPTLFIGMDCLICRQNMMNRPTSATECGHLFCTACILSHIIGNKACPNCLMPIGPKTIAPFTIPR